MSANYSIMIGQDKETATLVYSNDYQTAQRLAIEGAKIKSYASIVFNVAGKPVDIQRFYRGEQGEVTTMVYDPKQYGNIKKVVG